MSINEFWEGDPDLFWAYRFSYFEKMKNDQKAFNFQAWLQGLYFHEAVSVALNNAFTKNKRQKLKYSSKPYVLTKEDEEEEIQEKRQKLEAQIRNRIAEVQKIKGENESTTSKGTEVVNNE